MRDLIGWSTRREKSNAPRFAQLLRPRRERRRATEQRYELAACSFEYLVGARREGMR
jgi:hypothetical protein